MSIESFKIFLDLTQTCHFGKTSRHFFLTPAALTRLIQRLEKEVGALLFIRDSRSVKITEAGQVFKRYCEHQVETWENLQGELGHVSGGPTGLVRVYASVTASHVVLHDILACIKAKYPGITLALETGMSEGIFQKIQNYEVDIGLGTVPEHIPQDIDIKPIKQIPLSLIVPKGYGLKSVVSHEMPFIYPKSGFIRAHMRTWFKGQKINPKIYTDVSGFEGLMVLVSLGYGASVVPTLMYETHPLRHGIHCLALDTSITPLSLGLSCKKKKQYLPAIKAFMGVFLP